MWFILQEGSHISLDKKKPLNEELFLSSLYTNFDSFVSHRCSVGRLVRPAGSRPSRASLGRALGYFVIRIGIKCAMIT